MGAKMDKGRRRIVHEENDSQKRRHMRIRLRRNPHPNI
jgi:hypothetical protein